LVKCSKVLRTGGRCCYPVKSLDVLKRGRETNFGGARNIISLADKNEKLQGLAIDGTEKGGKSDSERKLS